MGRHNAKKHTITRSTVVYAAGWALFVVLAISIVSSSTSVTSPARVDASPAVDVTPKSTRLTVEDVRPQDAPLTGGTTVYINGRNFSAGTEVWFGSYPATAVKLLSSTTIQAVAPPAPAPAEAPVTVRDGEAADTLADSFRYADTLTITSVIPASGPAAGGQEVTLTGSGFAPDSHADIGGLPQARITYVDQHTLKIITAPQPAGRYDVNVGNDDDTADAAGGYLFQ